MNKVLTTVAELQQHLHDPDVVVVDCRFSLADPARGRQAYHAGHIPGAVYAHLDEDLSAPVIKGVTGRHPLPDPQALVERFSAWGIGSGIKVIAYDDAGGAYASRLWWLLHWLGHEEVTVLDGGWDAWVNAGYTITTEPAQNMPKEFQPVINSNLVADAALVAEAAQNSDYVVVDSREEPRYRGEMEPIDPVAGHIPGAVNIPYGPNMDVDKHWRDPATLKHRFAPVTGDHSADRVIFYCGSGVTACHNILAFAHAGLGMATLYAGSWSEWITDPERPVATIQNNQ